MLLQILGQEPRADVVVVADGVANDQAHLPVLVEVGGRLGIATRRHAAHQQHKRERKRKSGDRHAASPRIVQFGRNANSFPQPCKRRRPNQRAHADRKKARPGSVAGVYDAGGAGAAIGRGAQAIVLANQSGAVLALTGYKRGLQINADLSGLALSMQ